MINVQRCVMFVYQFGINFFKISCFELVTHNQHCYVLHTKDVMVSEGCNVASFDMLSECLRVVSSWQILFFGGDNSC